LTKYPHSKLGSLFSDRSLLNLQPVCWCSGIYFVSLLDWHSVFGCRWNCIRGITIVAVKWWISNWCCGRHTIIKTCRILGGWGIGGAIENYSNFSILKNDFSSITTPEQNHYL
jgi:hypothetical protein